MKARFDAVSRGWLMGQTARFLFGYDFRANFARPLEDARRELGVDASLSKAGALRNVLPEDHEDLAAAA